MVDERRAAGVECTLGVRDARILTIDVGKRDRGNA